MKKLLAIFLCLSLFVTALFGCAKENETDKDTINVDSNTTVEQSTTIAATEDEKAILNMGKRIEDAQHWDNIFSSLGEGGEKLENSKNPYVNNESSTNYQVVEEFKSIADVKAHILSLNSKRRAEEIYFRYLKEDNENNIPPYLIEVDGTLYANSGALGGGGTALFDYDSIKIIKLEGNNAEIEINFYINDPNDIKTEKVLLVKESGNWVIDKLGYR